MVGLNTTNMRNCASL